MNEATVVQTHPTLDEILRRLRTCLPELRERYGVASLGVFGSYAHQAQTSNSDLDILVAFDQAPTFFRFIDLEDELSRLLDKKVDLVMKNALKPRIGERILSEVIMV